MARRTRSRCNYSCCHPCLHSEPTGMNDCMSYPTGLYRTSTVLPRITLASGIISYHGISYKLFSDALYSHLPAHAISQSCHWNITVNDLNNLSDIEIVCRPIAMLSILRNVLAIVRLIREPVRVVAKHWSSAPLPTICLVIRPTRIG